MPTLRIIFLILIMTQTLYAYQFRDYRWGTDMTQIESELKSRYEWVRKEDDRTIIIFDQFSNEPVKIDFIFTPKTKKLCAIIITLERDANYRIKAFLVKKYGSPVKEKRSIGNAIWKDSLSAIQLKDGFSHLKLIYMHIELYDLYEKEEEKKEKA